MPQHAMSCHGMPMVAAFGTLRANKDGIGKTGCVEGQTLEIAGVYVCGQLRI